MSRAPAGMQRQCGDTVRALRPSRRTGRTAVGPGASPALETSSGYGGTPAGVKNFFRISDRGFRNADILMTCISAWRHRKGARIRKIRAPASFVSLRGS
ncbi:hypothetical protein MICRO8M_20028 [Microbacterium sp. 8M]|nr:hypothetical protein MICRO8M_20028 [Microbacterium sp. 8M]